VRTGVIDHGFLQGYPGSLDLDEFAVAFPGGKAVGARRRAEQLVDVNDVDAASPRTRETAPTRTAPLP
jgi:hypothetical protein